jgi:AcrR family transcriptional regulator
MSSSPARPIRADAQRNHDAVLAAAKAVFAQAGTDAPMGDVARAAGVGKGTLYRRFPTREHLFAAILQDRVDELDASAQRALDTPDVWRALTEWLELYDRCATEYPGMSARVGESLSDGTSAVATMCEPMKNRALIPNPSEPGLATFGFGARPNRQPRSTIVHGAARRRLLA